MADKKPSGANPAPVRTSKIRPLIISAIGLLALALLWIAGGLLFMKVTIGTVTISARSSDSLIGQTAQQQFDAYNLQVTLPDKQIRKFPVGQTGISLDRDVCIRAVRQQQHAWKQLLLWWQPAKPALALRTDQTKVDTFIAKNLTIIGQEPHDASLTTDKGKIVLTPAVSGVQYGLDHPQAAVLQAVRQLQSQPLALVSVRKDPALTDTILAPYKAQLEKILGQPVSFTIGYKTVKPTPEDIAGWLDITPDAKTKKVDIAVNSGKVASYVAGITKTANRPPRAQVNLQDADGSTETFIAGTSGVQVLDDQAIAKQVADSVMQSKGVQQTLKVRWIPYKTITTGMHDKWIEVDLTNKQLYAYEGTNLVKTYPVSAGAPGTPTVIGEYKVYAKYASQNMYGSNVDGSSYFQPHVQWISYFYRDYAVHGNYWRPVSYFGSINSSHGCVGLVNSQAEWVYDWAPVGTTVITHT